MQGSRDRSRGQRQDVGLQFELFEPFLVFDTEPVLFVNDDQSEVLELDVWAEQSVRSDDDVDLSFLDLDEDGGLLLRRLEAAEHRDANRKVRQALGEGPRVL